MLHSSLHSEVAYDSSLANILAQLNLIWSLRRLDDVLRNPVLVPVKNDPVEPIKSKVLLIVSVEKAPF